MNSKMTSNNNNNMNKHRRLPFNRKNRAHLRKTNTRLYRSLHTAFVKYVLNGGTTKFDIYYDITSLFCKWIGQRLIDEGSIFMPKSLGELRVIGKKQSYNYIQGKTKHINWAKTMANYKQGIKQIIYNSYENTDGYIYFMVWGKRKVKHYNARIYKFTATIAMRRALEKAIKSGKEYTLTVRGEAPIRSAHPKPIGKYDYNPADEDAVMERYKYEFKDDYIPHYDQIYGKKKQKQ